VFIMQSAYKKQRHRVEDVLVPRPASSLSLPFLPTSIVTVYIHAYLSPRDVIVLCSSHPAMAQPVTYLYKVWLRDPGCIRWTPARLAAMKLRSTPSVVLRTLPFVTAFDLSKIGVSIDPLPPTVVILHTLSNNLDRLRYAHRKLQLPMPRLTSVIETATQPLRFYESFLSLAHLRSVHTDRIIRGPLPTLLQSLTCGGIDTNFPLPHTLLQLKVTHVSRTAPRQLMVMPPQLTDLCVGKLHPTFLLRPGDLPASLRILRLDNTNWTAMVNAVGIVPSQLLELHGVTIYPSIQPPNNAALPVVPLPATLRALTLKGRWLQLPSQWLPCTLVTLVIDIGSPICIDTTALPPSLKTLKVSTVHGVDPLFTGPSLPVDLHTLHITASSCVPQCSPLGILQPHHIPATLYHLTVHCTCPSTSISDVLPTDLRRLHLVLANAMYTPPLRLPRHLTHMHLRALDASSPTPLPVLPTELRQCDVSPSFHYPFSSDGMQPTSGRIPLFHPPTATRYLFQRDPFRH
jgi:hypothetical protein